MAQTISELERERAKLLEAIENQANQISAQRGSSTNEARPHTLNDWLNAAEEVMTPTATSVDTFDDMAFSARKPEKPRQTRRVEKETRKENKSAEKSKRTGIHPKNKTPFFGVIIMLALLLSVIGLIYIAYITAEKQLSQIIQIQAKANDRIEALELEIAELNKIIASGGNPEALDELVNQVNNLGDKVDSLDKLQRQQQTVKQAELSTKNLEQVSNQIESKLTLKLEKMLSQVANLAAEKQESDSKPSASTATEAGLEKMEIQTIPEPQAPQEPATPKIEQKVIKLVESQPSADMQWLKQQPANNFTLQLLALNNKQGLLDFAKQHKIQGAKIIEQKVDGKTTFVLVTGSYGQRASANQDSLKLKETTGTSPWVRQIQILQDRIN